MASSKLISRVNRPLSFSSTATVLSVAFITSAGLGLLRDRLLFAHFGLTGTLDAYLQAFQIPDFMYTLLVSGVFTLSLIPVLSEYYVRNEQSKAWRLASSLFNIAAIATFTASVLMLIFANRLIYLIAPGFDPVRHHLAVHIMRIFAFNPLLFSVASVLASVQQSTNRFLFNDAFVPVLYNLSIIFGILVLSPHFGIVGVAYGVTIGAIIQFGVQLLGMIGIGFHYTRGIDWRQSGLHKLGRLVVPRTLDQVLDQINAVVVRGIASFLIPGSIAIYQYGLNIWGIPVTLIGVVVATVAFPRLSETAAGNRIASFKYEALQKLRLVIWLTLPAAMVILVMRHYVVRLLLGKESQILAVVVGWFALSIVFRTVFYLIGRLYYARQNVITPLIISVFAITTNIILTIILTKRFGVAGMAIAQSIVTTLEVSTMVILLHRKLEGGLITRKFLSAVARMLVASGVMAIVIAGANRVLPLTPTDVGFINLVPRFFAIVSVSLLAYLVAGVLLRLEEVGIFFSSIKRLLSSSLKRV